jgi:hypothetical protein
MDLLGQINISGGVGFGSSYINENVMTMTEFVIIVAKIDTQENVVKIETERGLF